ncbi:MAG: MCP four helix bundle domain-containing protein [Deltaproteobacteria bacterium]|nr:MCP four helix bundle domain-containing protein [Deltaproteobacteria bacterium]
MPEVIPQRLRPTRRLVLYGPPILIVLFIVTTNLIDYVQWRRVREVVAHVNGDSLESIRLVQHMTANIERQRDLVERHIVEQDSAVMASIERELVATRADFDDTARAYGPIAVSRGEPEAFAQLRRDVEHASTQLDSVLRLSRQNLAGAEREELITVEPIFDAIDRDATTLLQINQTDAKEGTDQLQKLEGDAMTQRLTLAALTALVALASGFSVARRIERKEEERRQFAEALVVRNRELDAFAGRVAHDLRGPLSVVSMAATKLEGERPADSGIFALLRRGVGRMEALIADLLALSRVDAQTPKGVAQVADVVDAVRVDLAPSIQTVKGRLEVDVEPAAVGCSDGLLRQVLWNLGENAVKYRRVEVPLEMAIKGRVHGRRYRLWVQDNGTGMSPAEARQVFEPLFRAEGVQSLPGTGLGLSIVKRIVEAAGGSVGVDAAAGRGSTFWVELPLAWTARKAAAMERHAEI